MTSKRSILIILYFIIILLIVSMLAFLAFLMFPSFIKFSEFPARDNWSPIADALGLVLGIPTALAGSVVAIFLAHRAYEITEAQMGIEQKKYIQNLVDEISSLYWGISNSIHNVDTGLSNYVISSVRLDDAARALAEEKKAPSSTKENITALENILSIKKESYFQFQSEFNSSVNDLCLSIRQLSRNEVVRELWSKKLLSVVDTLNEENRLMLLSDANVGKMHADRWEIISPDPSILSRNIASELRNTAEHTSPSLLIRSLIIGSENGQILHKLPLSLGFFSFNDEEYDELSIKIQYALMQSNIRFSLIGYMIMSRPSQAYLFGLGVNFLAAISHAYPSADDIKILEERVASEFGLRGKETREYLQKALLGKSIPSYYPSWILDEVSQKLGVKRS